MHDKYRFKILIVSSLNFGGAETQLLRLIPRINRDIFDVRVAYYNSRTSFVKEVLEDAGIPIEFLGSEPWSKRRFILNGMAFMKKERFDVVHAWLSSANHYARLCALLRRVPVIIGGLRGKRGLDGIWPVVYSLMNPLCSGWIVNSRELKEYAERKMYFLHPDSIVRIPNGLEIDEEVHFRKGEHTRYDALKSRRAVIGIVGRFHPIKNHQLFLEMARELTKTGVDADYWIVGDGDLRSAIEDTIDRYQLGDRVKMLGICEDVDVALSRMDVLVLTSDSESCPNALLEAMRAALPVVSTRCTSLEEIIEEGKNGYTVDLGDVKGLADKVNLILSHPEKAREMGRYSRRIIEQRFTVSMAVKCLEEAYIHFLRYESVRHCVLREKLSHFGLL